jgi:hypothetical protein
MLILFYLALCLMASSLGVIEGVLYSLQGASAFKWNEHIIFGISRALILLCLIFSKFLVSDHEFIYGIGTAFLAFPFFHDGFYYITREMIDVTYYKFDSNSTTSSATTEVPWKYRLTLFIISVGIIVFDLLH